MKSLLLAAILVLPGCTILPDVADLVNALKCERAAGADILAYSAAVRRYGEEAWRERRRHPADYPTLFETDDNGRI